MGKNAKLICEGCVGIVKERVDGVTVEETEDRDNTDNVDHVGDDIQLEEISAEEDDDIPDDVMAVVSRLQDGMLNNSVKCLLSEALGVSIEKELYEETKQAINAKKYQDLSGTHNIKEIDHYLQTINPVLVQFLIGATIPKTVRRK